MPPADTRDIPLSLHEGKAGTASGEKPSTHRIPGKTGYMSRSRCRSRTGHLGCGEACNQIIEAHFKSLLKSPPGGVQIIVNATSWPL